MTLCDPNTMKLGNYPCMNHSNRFIHTLIIKVEQNFELIITNLYAPKNSMERRKLFDLLTKDRILFPDIPWIIM